MIKGHEIWIENSSIDNKHVKLSLMFGHNMTQDGAADKERFLATVYNPDKNSSAIEIMKDDDHLYLEFITEKKGYYTVIAEMGVVIVSLSEQGHFIGPKFQYKDVTYAGAFHQMAKKIIKYGETTEYHPEPIHGIFEAVPDLPYCNAGESINFSVYYEGKPIASADVKAISKAEGKEIIATKTDERGKASIPINSAGEWMILAKHADPTKRVSEEFDESVFVCTYVFEAG